MSVYYQKTINKSIEELSELINNLKYDQTLLIEKISEIIIQFEIVGAYFGAAMEEVLQKVNIYLQN